ncbi:MAG: MFS transporter [Acidimicrobiia bacterium]|nr:MFS transporter [Acidimicrobiia bacterium]
MRHPPKRLREQVSWRITAIILAAPLAVLSGMQLILPALHVMQQALGLTDAQISLVSSVYLLPGAFLAIPAGLLGDCFGRRFIFGRSLIVFGVAGGVLFSPRPRIGVAGVSVLGEDPLQVVDVGAGR